MGPHDFHLKAISTGDVDFILSFNDYNLLRQTAAEGILPAAVEAMSRDEWLVDFARLAHRD